MCWGQVSIDMNKERNCNVAPELHITWDTEAVGMSPADVLTALDDGEPRIQCAVSQVKRRRAARAAALFQPTRLRCWQGSEDEISFMPHMMEPGEDVMVRDRLLEVLEAAVVSELEEARARL